MADFTVGNIYIFLTNISEGTAFLSALSFGKRPRQPSDI